MSLKQVSYPLLSDIIVNHISVVDMLKWNNSLSKAPQLYATFYAVKSTKMDENQFSFFSELEIIQWFWIYSGFFFAVPRTRQKYQSHSVFLLDVVLCLKNTSPDTNNKPDTHVSVVHYIIIHAFFISNP